MANIFDFVEPISCLCEGNPGAATVLAQLVNHCSKGMAQDTLEELAIQGCTGERIWLRFKDECGEDIGRFIYATVIPL